MVNRVIGSLLIVAAAVLLVGCGHQMVVPYPDTHPLDSLPEEFTSTQSVAVLNVQTDTSPHIYIEAWTDSAANYQDWTEVAKQVLERELIARGIQTSDSADRVVALRVTDVEHWVGWVKLETRVTIEVELANGYSATLVGRNNAVMASMPQRQVDGALMRAVAAVLGDPKVVAYVRGD